MSNALVLAIACGAALLLFWAIYKLIKAAVFALVAAVCVGAALFYYLPRMEPTTGKLEELRQQAAELSSDLDKHKGTISDNVEQVSNSLENMATLANELVGTKAQKPRAGEHTKDDKAQEAESKKDDSIMKATQDKITGEAQPAGLQNAIQHLNLSSPEMMEALTQGLKQAKEKEGQP